MEELENLKNAGATLTPTSKIVVRKEEQKKALIDMMKQDEDSGMYGDGQVCPRCGRYESIKSHECTRCGWEFGFQTHSPSEPKESQSVSQPVIFDDFLNKVYKGLREKKNPIDIALDLQDEFTIQRKTKE